MVKRKLIKCNKCERERVPHGAFGLCTSCYKGKVEKCIICGEVKKVSLRNENNEAICGKCNKKECSVCHNINYIVKNNEDGPVCRKCYDKEKERRLDICSICGELNPVKCSKDKIICERCYGKTYIPPQKICFICGELKEVCKYENKNPICQRCYNINYKTPIEICTKCGKEKEVCMRIDGEFPICSGCYASYRRENDEEFWTIGLLRKRVYNAIESYSKTGKIKSACEYGINYEAIIRHLGPCPGPREDYHIDHILPLSAFDFNDPEHIKKAFAPENHQWLIKEENLSKNAKYKEEDLEKYLNSGEK